MCFLHVSDIFKHNEQNNKFPENIKVARVIICEVFEPLQVLIQQSIRQSIWRTQRSCTFLLQLLHTINTKMKYLCTILEYLGTGISFLLYILIWILQDLFFMIRKYNTVVQCGPLYCEQQMKIRSKFLGLIWI